MLKQPMVTAVRDDVMVWFRALFALGKISSVAVFAEGMVQYEARQTQQDLFAPSSRPRMFSKARLLVGLTRETVVNLKLSWH